MDGVGDTLSGQAGLLTELLAEVANPILKELGISRATFDLISAVAGAGDASQAELARRLGVAPATMSEAIQKTIQAGLIERSADPADARLKRVSLTAHGRAVIRTTFQSIKSAEREAVERIPAEDWENALRTLRTLNRSLAEIIAKKSQNS